mmetsp:Transcript_46829/g.134907  ORF Transcript_46829/g.134907 Transcript_46829/m.134907 type:complete len:106 (+) Transcript_46829:139-456(+)
MLTKEERDWYPPWRGHRNILFHSGSRQKWLKATNVIQSSSSIHMFVRQYNTIQAMHSEFRKPSHCALSKGLAHINDDIFVSSLMVEVNQKTGIVAVVLVVSWVSL